MKECRIIHINDGNRETIRNEGCLFVEEVTCTEKIIGEYIKAGYEVKHIIPEIMPAKQYEGMFTFYKDGITVYLEREYVDDGSDEQIHRAIRELDPDELVKGEEVYEDDAAPVEHTFVESDFDEIDFDEILRSLEDE
ncbi:MAG: hypothetical protein IJ386_03655 [Clostridia bacterium]|nr:hypothetical protein [Clostridia bacterium]